MDEVLNHLDTFSLFAATGFLVHWAIVIGLSARIIMRHRPVGISLAWIAIVFSIPLIGALFYLMIGENRISERYIRRARAVREVYLNWQADLRRRNSPAPARLGGQAAPLARQAESLTGFPVLDGNRVRLIEGYAAIFESIIRDVGAARRTCHLEFYIWQPGGMTDALQQALIDACARGVICRVVVDAIGSREFLKGRAARDLRAAGVRLVSALPTGMAGMFLSRADLRNHRKMIVIDGAIAYTGSQNMVDPRFFKQEAGVGRWIDAMIRLEGPVVETLAGTFLQDWAVVSGAAPEQLAHTGDISPVTPAGTAALQVVPSGPSWRPMAIHQLLLTTLYAARTELIITTPYFIPDDALLSALVSATHRGVEVTLILPADNDSLLVRHASRSFYTDLLDAGVRIALFHGGLLHTKSYTVDGDIAVFGSVNLDMRSIWINFELSLFVYDSDTVAEIRAMQQGYLAHSVLLDAREWQQRPLLQRFLDNTVHLASPLL